MPDIIGAYRYNGDFGCIKAAGLFRELRYETDKARSQFGYGALLMGKLKIGEKDNLKFQGVMGNGIARKIIPSHGRSITFPENGPYAQHVGHQPVSIVVLR